MTSELKDGGPAELTLVCGSIALVDRADIDALLMQRWRLGSNGYVYRAGGKVKGRPCLLHRIILNAKSGLEVHHLNGVKTDCRRENLLLVSPAEHQEKFHAEDISARNRAARVHPTTGTCPECGCSFVKHRDHRGTQRLCSKTCSMAKAVRIRMEAIHATR